MYKIGIIILIFLSGILMNRYKSHYFKDFSGGEGHKFLNEKKTEYDTSTRIQVSEITKKLKLEKDLIISTLPHEVYEWNITTDGEYIYTVVYDSTLDRNKLYRSTDGETFTLHYTFGATHIGNRRIGYENGTLFIFFELFGGYIASSKDGGSSWVFTPATEIESGTMYVSYWAKLDDYIYYVYYSPVNGQTIVRTKNFINVETIFQSQIDEYIVQIVEFKEFIYFVQGNTLYKLENFKPVKIRSFSDYPMIIPIQNKVIAIFLQNSLYTVPILYDGITYKYLNKIDEYSVDAALFEENGFAYFSMYKPGIFSIFKINENGEIFKEYDNTDTTPGGISFKNYHVFLGRDDKILKSKNYKLSGTIDLATIDEGDIIPVALVVRHKPLVAGTVVNVYAKKDQATSWGSALIVSNTTSAVKKEYKFPNAGSKCSFLQLQIELTSNSSSNSPEDVSLEIIYLPAGLKNAK